MLWARTDMYSRSEMNAWLRRGLVFNDKIEARHRMHIRPNFGSGRGNRQSRGGIRVISGKRRPEQSRVWGKGPNGCGSRIGARRAKGSKGQRGAMEDKYDEVSVSLSIRSLISRHTCTCKPCTLAAPSHPLHYIATLDSVSEARYVCRQGREI